MLQQLPVWQILAQCLVAQQPAMLLYVVQSEGSSPGRAGFAMVACADGSTAGSIGGGIMEHKFLELARQRLAANSTGATLHEQVHRKSAGAHQSGMICSGRQTIALYHVAPADLQTVQQTLQALGCGGKGWVQLSPTGLQFIEQMPASTGFVQHSSGWWQSTQPIGFWNRLYIVGGGHCSLALSRLMRTLDFFVTVFEDRPGLNTFEANSEAHQKIQLGSYAGLATHLAGQSDAFVVVMTFGYRSDDVALRALYPHTFAYLGVLGSAAKIAKMFGDYREEAWSEAWLNRLSAPAGIYIKSETPAEIAVSIAAEIIKVKNLPAPV